MNIQENIDKMKLELAEMEKQLQAEKQIELRGGGWSLAEEPIDNRTNGLLRAKEHLVIEMRDRIVTSSQIEARAREIDPDWVTDWDNLDQKKYYICLLNTNNRYGKDWHTSIQDIGTPYMSKATARQIVTELNEGRFVLGYKE